MKENAKIAVGEFFTLAGKVIQVGEERVFGDFRIRECILTDLDADPKYPSVVPVVFKNAKADLLDNIEQDDEVEINAVIGGRWNKTGDRAFLEISGFKITRTGGPEREPEGEGDEPKWLEKATRKDVFTAYMTANGITATDMTKELNDRESAFTKLRQRLFPKLKWSQFKENSVELATIVNEITGAKKPEAGAAASDIEEMPVDDPEDLPF